MSFDELMSREAINDISIAIITQRVRAALELAVELDVEALNSRRAAGRMLSLLRNRATAFDWNLVMAQLNLDPRLGELLIELSHGNDQGVW